MEVKTVCPYCGVGCNIIVVSDGNKILNIIPSKYDAINYGTICIKGWKGLSFAESNKRLKKPLLKKGDGFIEITWEEAIKIAVKRLKEIFEKYGPDSIGFQSSAKCTNEDNYLMQKLARQVFKTNNVDHCARSCHASTIEGLISTIGSGAMTTSIRDIDNSELYFIIGSNTTEQHPIIGARIINNVLIGKKLILADPRKIQISNFATIHMRQYPGTDLALLNTMANVIVEKGLYDKKFIEERTENFEEYLKVIDFYDVDRGSRITGVEPELIEKAAIMYAKSRSIIFYAMGITQHTQGTENVQAIANLAMLTGNIGKKGTGIAPLRGHNNVQGASDMGALADFLPGYRRVYDDEGRKIFEKAWNTQLPSKPGAALNEMFDLARKGKIKGLYIMGENPVISEPESDLIIESFKNLEFLIVQDIFLTETAIYADLVLPSLSFAEKLGTFTNTERRIQMVRPFLSPPGEAKADWEIITMIAREMGYDWRYSSPEDIMNEISSLVPQYSGLTYSCIEYNGVQWPVNGCKGTEIMHTQNFTRGKGKFIPSYWKRPDEYTDKEYPFILTTGRLYYQFHTGTMTRKSNILEREAPEPFAEINPDDAKTMGIRDGDCIKITSKYGSVNIRARLTDMVPKGILFAPFHYFESPINRITNPKTDPVAKIPELKVTAVRIERCYP
ncbi:MAG: formate dehydrogenase subunit alpha [Thermoplasmata archaeon]|jgi:formate dehydrogenase alpha subunit|nr:formate dehydrogenase subunit alpha [Thermoplasmata archaeon]